MPIMSEKIWIEIPIKKPCARWLLKKKIQCQKCQKELTTAYGLRSHLKIHQV